MNPTARTLLLTMMTFSAGCAPTGEAMVDTSGVEATIRGLARAVAAYDFEATKALYEPGGTWIEMGTDPIGLDSLRQRTAPMQALGVTSSWEPTDIRVASEGRVAWATWCWCPGTFRVESENAAGIMRQIFGTDDPEQREWRMDMMVSAVLRKHGDKWLFVQGHVSPKELRAGDQNQ